MIIKGRAKFYTSDRVTSVTISKNIAEKIKIPNRSDMIIKYDTEKKTIELVELSNYKGG